ncbi:phosphogluconate dehydratase [Pseudomonas tremae]|uniref:phosphogluconate dehydratase n=1 Tax=Pseudomonas syringae group TaxID=136849 RepID=UPI000F009394|nr:MULTISPECIES: phosphogluconate dehydratase [Pseudomonas syringae group]MCF5710902.1 phosphogluconate dehydratase [Pseudomonas tremae]MCF5743240.1 phosphogluconate dehydratase [Pseudomonas tremae]MCQ2989847.1 phosphogluconate dehydratase [Pseudomonas tremae]RMP23219.1 Phosphogluconate dehydratase [Pseudomonas coronafaciens pv. atropurpurea]RMS09052.1 Phosphogluconate dehydratase [Pseudomonas coronafaciens pv. coronafaciens]
MHPRILEVTERLIARSRDTRQRYLQLIRGAASDGPMRGKLQCANFAHGVAACGPEDKQNLRLMNAANVAIVSSYNEMLSAHQPYEHFPAQIKQALRDIGSVGQFAGGVPAMCDGVTQGEPGMELAIASREVIAMSTAIALSHNMFDAALMLGICDKIVPGLMMGALRFGHLPTVFVPGGPMVSGISNKQKADVRQRYAEGKASREELLDSEMKSYHGPGTCTFYGTANTNQLLMEVMGLHLPGASFVNPYTPLRDALTAEAARQVTRMTMQSGDFMPIGEIVDERSLVNSIVALHATGGSTNHTLHMPAIAQAAGIQLTWQDMADLSEVVPTLSHVYPNGKADINHFQAAGGMSFLIRELLAAGLLHENVNTVAGYGLSRYTREPFLEDGKLVWREGPLESLDESILRPVSRPFSPEGGLRVMEGNLGRGVMKVSAVAPEHQIVEAPARVFQDQKELADAFKAGELECDFVAVMRFQGPRCNGMPELHKMTPFLGVLQDRGFKVALVTDGRMSGASGKIPAAIHVCPEAFDGGPLALVRDGDVIRVDGVKGTLQVLVEASELVAREPAVNQIDNSVGCGRELFGFMRMAFSSAEQGASAFTSSLETLK